MLNKDYDIDYNKYSKQILRRLLLYLMEGGDEEKVERRKPKDSWLWLLSRQSYNSRIKVGLYVQKDQNRCV